MSDEFSLGRFVLSAVILAAGIGGFVLMGKPEVPKRPPATKKPRAVQTVNAPAHTDGIQFEVDGVVVPFRQINIAAQVAGRVAFKADHCRTGQTVKKDEVLFRIDQDDYKLEVTRLEEEVKQAAALIQELDAEIETADNQIASTKEQLAIDKRQVERNQMLLDRRAASESELDSARRSEVMTRNAMQKLQDDRTLLMRRKVRLESATALQQANLEKAKLALERTEIRSPMDGVVVSEDVEQDGYVQSGNTVVRIQDTSQLDVTCKLHMRQMNWLWQSQSGEDVQEAANTRAFPETPATVIYDLGRARYQWKAVVNRLDGAGIDDQTRMVPCRVNVSNPNAAMLMAMQGENDSVSSGDINAPPALMTGMFVKVRIDAQPPIPLVRLPQKAIQPGNTVWTVIDGKLKQKSVRIANADETSVIAYQENNGLVAGDAVIVSPLATPIEGAEVNDIGDQDPADIKVAAPPAWGGRGGGPPGGKPRGGGKPNAGGKRGSGGKPSNGKPASERGNS